MVGFVGIVGRLATGTFVSPPTKYVRIPSKVGVRRPQMTGHGTQFGRKKEAAIQALLTQRNLDEAARVVGVSPKTLRRWQQLPEFQSAYRTACREGIGLGVARLQQATGAAVTTLLKIMVDGQTPAATKARVADLVLANAFKGTEIADFAVSIAQLERAVRNSNSSALGNHDPMGHR
jgi:hypothetical protein